MSHLHRMTARIQGRFRRARPGSVLILVIALLVIMALLGTAFISTARIDRYGSAQNAANTQIDLLVEGVKNLVIGGIIGDLYNGANVYRPPTELEQGSNYEHHDSHLVDQYLAARVPIDDTTLPYWRTVSWPLVQNGTAAAPYQFDSPAQHTPVQLPPAVTAGTNYKPEYRFVPWSDSLSGDANYPFLRVFRKIGAGANTQITTGTGIPAADVDGDGIADAGLWKLPMGPIDGITYFAASRVIDNNSAWNGSTAWTQNVGEPAVAGANLVGNFFPSNVDLQAMLANPATEIDTLNTYRFNGTAPAAVTAAVPAIYDNTPTNKNFATRGDIAYMNAAEALWMQLGRRLDYPGYNAAGLQYQPLPFSDSLALAYKFCIVPPGGATAEIEKLTASYITGARTQSYSGDVVGRTNWYDENFDYGDTLPGGPPGFKPLRAITVARNPVANSRPSYSLAQPAAGQVGFRGAWTATPAQTYLFGDWVTGPAPSFRPYVCIRPHASATGNSPTVAAAQGVVWQEVPWGDQPVKANINTASFGELWHGFFDVMVDRNGDQTYFAPTNSSTTPPAVPVTPAFNEARQFRNASRDVSITGRVILNPYQMMLLRSAISAVNAIDLRDSDSDVTSRDIMLHAGPNTPGDTHFVTVYGTERQPYITEVLVDTSAPGFIAVELHNPDPVVPMDLTGWRLGAVDRRPVAIRPRVVQDVLATAAMDLGTALTMATASPAIPPGGYIVLIDGTAAADVQADLVARGIIPVPVPGMAALPPMLTSVFDRELVVLRTRNASGIPSVASTPGDVHNEGTDTAPNFGDMAPVDQIDLTGISPATTGGQRFVYRRASLPAGTPATAWHFTHSGPYNPAPPLNTPRHAGLRLGPGDPGNLGAADLYFGAANINATYATRPMQIANTDTAGPRKMYAQLSGAAAAAHTPEPGPGPGGAFAFPYGGFARNGDIMQVPFVGAYRLLLPGENRETSVRELNSVAMDAVFADDFDATNDWAPAENGNILVAREQDGRFCPVGNPGAALNLRGDYEPLPVPFDSANATHIAIKAAYRYQWAMDLFDHLTVQSPGDDYLPDVDPEDVVTTELPPPPTKMPGAYQAARPKPTANATYTIANDNIANAPVGATEGKVPVEGLVNINTASWKVLAAMPMMLNADGTVNAAANETLAKAIVDYRDGTPSTATVPMAFRTIYDLYKVPEFTAAQNVISTSATEPNDAQGDLSPTAAAADGVRYDFEERFLLLNRISNMITTRSDSYTVYLLVQGWQDAGTPTPTLRTQRRLAFIVDRSRLAPTTPQVTPTPIPNN